MTEKLFTETLNHNQNKQNYFIHKSVCISSLNVMCTVFFDIPSSDDKFRSFSRLPVVLKKLMGHIAFGACVRGCVRACVTLFVPTITFKPLKLES